jgi:hypothetical protein
MAERRATSQNLKSIAGASLLAVGFVVLLANLDGVAASLCNVAGIPVHEAPGILPALGLAALHAAQSYAFDHQGFLSGVLQILVSFWPVILILVGALLLREVFRGSFSGRPYGVLRQLGNVDGKQKRNAHLKDDRRIP